MIEPLKQTRTCKQEARQDNGDLIMAFTKGKEYDFTLNDEGAWDVVSDDGTIERFFGLDIMFEDESEV